MTEENNSAINADFVFFKFLINIRAVKTVGRANTDAEYFNPHAKLCFQEEMSFCVF